MDGIGIEWWDIIGMVYEGRDIIGMVYDGRCHVPR